MSQSGFSDGRPVVPSTQDATPQEPTAIDKLAGQISQTQEALAKLVELQANQMQPAKEPTPELQPPSELKSEDILNPDSETGKYFFGVLQNREKRIVEAVSKEYEDRLSQIEANRMMEARLNGLASEKELPPERLGDFKKWMSSPENVDMATLYEVYNKTHPLDKKPQAPAGRMTQVGTAGGGQAKGGFIQSLK